MSRPGGKCSASTVELLLDHGFRYDHSQGYNDFAPFYARVGDSGPKSTIRNKHPNGCDR